MKKLVNLWILLSFFSLANAQEQCGTDDLIRRNPFLMERMACAPEVNLDTAQVLTIPVVFHIVHLGESVGEETNISNEQILSCVENLNYRFRGDVEALSALTDEYDEYELSLVKDSKIEFCLASRDPDNLPTNGINRIDASNLTYESTFLGQPIFESYAEDGISNGNGDGIPHGYLKDLYHWPVDKYFNCWVVSEINGNDGGNGIQGFAVLGSSGTGMNGSVYGPVCLYNVTGTTGILKPGRELNATWTHEIGHAFNLYHTFSNGFVTTDSCEPEDNPCTQGDNCPDTPPTPTNQSCNFPSCPDAMVENYMDYTPEVCKTAFTQNQIERMREEIWTGLPYLLNTLSCQSPVGQDLAITNVTLPDSWCQPTIDFNVTIANQGGGPTLYPAILDINGEYYEIPILEGGEYYTFNFIDYELPETGNVYTYIIYDADEYPVNDGILTTVEIAEENWAQFYMNTDNWANEILWSINSTQNNFAWSQPDSYPIGQNSYLHETCLPDGCYVLTIQDTNGDGLCSIDFNNDGVCDIGGSFSLVINGVEITGVSVEDSDYGDLYVFEFCTYYCPPEPCAGDLDGDGIVGIHDLLSFLQTPTGNITECSPLDFNNDLFIDVDDALTFLNFYGYNCFTGEYADLTIPEEAFNTLTNVTEPHEGVCNVKPPIYFDLTGRKVNEKGRLAPGIYIVVEENSNGQTTSRKVYLNSWSQ